MQRLSVWFDKVHLQISRIPRAVLIHFTMAEMYFGDVIGVLVYLRCSKQVSCALFHSVLQGENIIVHRFNLDFGLFFNLIYLFILD